MPRRTTLQVLDGVPLPPNTPALEWDTLTASLRARYLTAHSEALGAAADAVL